jgi:HTH-type transcriptional regulator/antitoxin HigA
VRIAPIKTEADYDEALREIERLMDSEPGSRRGDRLDVLVTLVEAYEHLHWRIEAPDPIEAIKIRMAERGLRRRDLEKLLGSSGRVSEILNRKRPLTVDMMQRLYAELAIPAESFMRPMKKKTPRRRKTPAAV